MSYPARLEQELKDRFPDIEIRVINSRGRRPGRRRGPDASRPRCHRREPLSGHLSGWHHNAVLRSDELFTDEQLIGAWRRLDEGEWDRRWPDGSPIRAAGSRSSSLGRDGAADCRDYPARSCRVGSSLRDHAVRDRIHKLAPAAMMDMTDASYGCLACQLADALARIWLASAKFTKSSWRSPDAVAGVAPPGSSQRAGTPRQR